MREQLKYVNFYRLSLLEGCYTGLEPTRGFTLSLSGTSRGSHITQMFDTMQQGCTFHRLVVDGRFDNAKLEVIAAACDETDAFIGDKPQNLEAYLKSPSVPASDKAQALMHMQSHVRLVNTEDMLLHSLKGRYIWIYVALYPMGECDCELEGVRLELPKCSFTEYFPEIYHGNDFFDRYIGVFQSMFLDVEHMVDQVPQLLDYRTTPDENVEYLAGWLGIDNSRGLFTAEQLRYMIRNIDIFQGAKGTKRALEAVIILVTGIRPRILEYFQWGDPRYSAGQISLNSSLYGETASHFCVILDLTGAQTAEGFSETALDELIEAYSVMGSQFKVVYLRTCNHSDTHCYLDINAALSVPEVAELDGGSFGGHITIG